MTWIKQGAVDDLVQVQDEERLGEERMAGYGGRTGTYWEVEVDGTTRSDLVDVGDDEYLDECMGR